MEFIITNEELIEAVKYYVWYRLREFVGENFPNGATAYPEANSQGVKYNIVANSEGNETSH
jgi:hypothetical protein